MATLTRSINAAGLIGYETKSLFQAVLSDLNNLRNSVAGVLAASATYNLASLVDGTGATTTVTCPGAQLGDFAFASLGVDLQGISMTAYVSAADTVAVRFQNESAGTLDLASATLSVRVLPASVNARLIGMLDGSNTALNVASLIDAAGETDNITVTGAALGDFVLVSHGVDLQGILLTGYVSAADTATLRFQNETAGTLDLAVTTARVRIIPSATAAALNAMGSGVLYGSATYDAASLNDAAGATTTITVTGAQIGDFPLVSFGVDLQGITVTAYVSAADTVSVRVQNESGGTLDLASTTVRALVMKASATNVALPLSLAA